MEQKFVHLRLHTEYSISDGLIAIPSLMAKLSQQKMAAVGMTDLSNLYATIKFYQAALQHGIKPIIGADLYIKQEAPILPTRITLLCQSNEGYHNLTKLVSQSYLEGQIDGRPLIERSWLTSLSTGLIALSGAEEGDVGLALINNDRKALNEALDFWQQHFPNRYYVEISRTGKPNEADYLAKGLKLAEKQNLPVVATNNVRFLNRNDFEAHEARVCIQAGTILADPARARHYTEQQYLRSTEDMLCLFADIPEALENSVEIAKRCNVTFELGINQLPHFPVPEGETTEAYLCDVAKQGLEDRLQTLFDTSADTFTEQRKPYDARLARELDVIMQMGFAGYFLIVADFTRWAKENRIPVGPGRGSGPGSLVAYALKITDLDPLALELLFERFLNPERVSMPDFDIDFCMERRDRVIQYVMEKHGHDSVSQIITYGTMAAKAVVRDVGRVQGLPYGFVDKIAKLIPFELGMTLDKALEQEALLKERYEKEEDVKNLIDLALKLEGLTRNVGKHAGGIVIAPGKLTDFVPLYCESNEPDHPVTQFDKDDVEAVGLVKFDFLGLKTLTIIDRALRTVKDPIDINLIPLQDEKTFELLKACQSTAVFQLESSGMRDLIKRLQPDCFEDLIALVALFRPGPLQSGMVDDFINRKHGRSKVIYPHPKLESILKPTYGVILYQEQVMQIAQELAGYTLGAADILRRAMGKKKPEEMAKQRQIFCEGAVTRGVNTDVATHIFDLMEKFAGYGFNKSHSASYALIAYQTAWLKAHYPAEFMSAVLSSDMDRTEKVLVFLKECEAFKLHVSPPDINKSNYFFTVVDSHHLNYGLGAIKGVGEAAIENIIETRNHAGLFSDLFDLCSRIDLHKVNRRALEALIKSGSLDSFGQNRHTLMLSLNKAIQQAEQQNHDQMFGQHDLLGMIKQPTEVHYIEGQPWPEGVQLQGEKTTLGYYLTGHPLNRYLNELSNITTCRIGDLHPSTHKQARIAGIVTQIRTRQTKRGDRIAIFTLDDGSTQIEVVCFSEPFQTYRHLLTEDQLVIIDGEISMDDFSNQPRVSVKEMKTIDEARERFAKALHIHVSAQAAFKPEALQSILSNYVGGKCPVSITLLKDAAKASVRLGSKWLVNPTDDLLAELIEQQWDVEMVY